MLFVSCKLLTGLWRANALTQLRSRRPTVFLLEPPRSTACVVACGMAAWPGDRRGVAWWRVVAWRGGVAVWRGTGRGKPWWRGVAVAW